MIAHAPYRMSGTAHEHLKVLVDDCQNVACGENQVLFALVLDLGATVAGEHDNVAFLDVYGNAVALLIHAARANGDNACFLRLFLRSFGDDQTGCGGLLSLLDLDNDAVFQGLDSHNRFLRVVDLRLIRDSGAVARPMTVSSATSTLVSPVLSVKKSAPLPGCFTARRTLSKKLGKSAPHLSKPAPRKMRSMPIPASPFTPAAKLPFSAEALAAADELYPLGSDTLSAVTSLRSRGFSPEESAQIISLAQARTRARAKFGERARTLMLTQEAAEQATRPVIAHYRAQRLRPVAGTVADLGCGIASDSAVYAADRGAVVAVELNPLTASFAAKNLEFCPQARVYSGDVTDYVHGELLDAAGEPVGIVWMDPARRELRGAKKAQTERLFDPEAFSPPFSFVLNLARTGVPMGVKLGPGFPHEGIPSPEDIASEANPNPRVEAEWIQSEGSLAELVLWFNALAQEGVARTATSVRELSDEEAAPNEGPHGGTAKTSALLPPYEAVSFRSPLTAEEAQQSVEVPTSLPQPGEYLLEPAPAIVRSHLVAEFAQSIGAHLLDEHLAYLCSAEPVEHPLVACYEVLEEIPLQEKQLKRWVREQGFTALTIKKRGVDIVPEQLRARLLGSAGSMPSKKKQKKNANSSLGAQEGTQESSYRPATLVFTRIGSGRDSRRVGWHVRPL